MVGLGSSGSVAGGAGRACAAVHAAKVGTNTSTSSTRLQCTGPAPSCPQPASSGMACSMNSASDGTPQWPNQRFALWTCRGRCGCPRAGGVKHVERLRTARSGDDHQREGHRDPSERRSDAAGDRSRDAGGDAALCRHGPAPGPGERNHRAGDRGRGGHGDRGRLGRAASRHRRVPRGTGSRTDEPPPRH